VRNKSSPLDMLKLRCQDVSWLSKWGHFSLKYRGEIKFGVIYIEMVFKTEEWINDQLERCY